MVYKNIQKAVFIKRPNRFIAHVDIHGKGVEIVHVKNTGRCAEILKAGAPVILEKSGNADRKTLYSLVSAYKGNVLINIDSQAPNKVVYDALVEGKLKELSHVDVLKKEATFGNSRFDLYFEKVNDKGLIEKGFIEVKGVTLENNGIAMFPDAPTSRGTKHVIELMEAHKLGYTCLVFFLIQMKGVYKFVPNSITDPDFASALLAAKEAGVKIIAYDSIVTENSIIIGDPVETF
ncbi:MAG TPA: DNA/RNA nuclease SfsA [Clostridiaceae bacterium]|nr:DNA/RNA nuclease SfsA [Clostridiaceae bacterium]